MGRLGGQRSPLKVRIRNKKGRSGEAWPKKGLRKKGYCHPRAFYLHINPFLVSRGVI